MKYTDWIRSQTRLRSKRLFASLSTALVAGSSALVFVAESTRAADRRVPSARYPTIGAAVAMAQSGDRILVGPGIYQANVTSSVPNLRFIGRSSVWDGTLVDGTAGVCLTSIGDLTVVRGFTFRAGSSNVAQVQLTGAGCRVSNCSSRGPSARFLKITGNSAVVESCSMFAVNSTGIEIIGDGALVRKVSSHRGDDDVIRVQGNGATVTGCTMVLNEDAYSINISGDDALVSLNMFLYCDFDISVSGANATLAKNKSVRSANDFLTADGPGAVVVQNTATRGGGPFLLLVGSNAVVRQNKASDCRGDFLSVSGVDAVVERNTALHCGGSFFLSLDGDRAVVRQNKAMDSPGSFFVSGDDTVVDQNQALNLGSMDVTGDNLTIRGNTITGAPNDRYGIFASQRTDAGGAVIEDNKVTDAASYGLLIDCNHAVVQRNRIIGAGSESIESGCTIFGNSNRLTNNVVRGGGTHGFDLWGVDNVLVNCSAIDAAADGFHIRGNGSILLKCVAMLCTGEGLDNGAMGTTVLDCLFKRNRLDVANDGTFSNADTFVTDNVFVTGGPNQLPQVD